MTAAEKLQRFQKRADELHRQIGEHRAVFGGWKTSIELKQAVLTFSAEATAEGLTRRRIAQMLRMDRHRLRTWHQEAEAAAASQSELLPVAIVEAPGVDKFVPVERAVVLVSPGGWRVEGLALSELVTLLQTLP